MLLDSISTTQLNNGLKVITLRKPGAPIVAMQVWYKIGSIREENGIRGISHLLEHMMFRGSDKYKSEEHARKINEVGGHSNAFTAEDITVFTNSVPREFCEMVFALEADRMNNLLLNEKLFETERKVVIEEFHLNMNNPVSKAFLEFRQEFFGSHPYAIGPIGVMEDLQTVTVEQCREYYTTWYRPDNAVITVVGDIEPKAVTEMAERYFGGTKNGSTTIAPDISDISDYKSLTRSHRMKRVVDFEVPLLIVGYPGPSSSHEDAVALEILQLIVAGGESSRLHREVVRKKSAAVMVGGMNHLLKHAGMSMFLAAFTPDVRIAKVEDEIEKVIRQIRNEGITADEMAKIKNTTLANRTFELYNAENICQRLGYSECIEGDYKMWVQRLETLEKLDRKSLIATAEKYWNEGNRHILHLKPRKTNPLLFAAGLFRKITRKKNQD